MQLLTLKVNLPHATAGVEGGVCPLLRLQLLQEYFRKFPNLFKLANVRFGLFYLIHFLFAGVSVEATGGR